MPASLSRRDVEDRPRGLVLMLHGGRAEGLAPVDDGSASWRRSRWMMDHIHRRLNRAGVSVWLLRYSTRGWNARVASPPSPVPDARWALDEVRLEHGDVPVVLLGPWVERSRRLSPVAGARRPVGARRGPPRAR